MIIPSDASRKKNLLQFVLETCITSQTERRRLYEKRRNYFLFGQDTESMVKFNRLQSHIPLLCSFLFQGDQCAFDIAAPKNASEQDVAKWLAVQDDWNESFQDDGLADVVDEAIQWAVIYDTMMIKQGWNDITSSQYALMIDPSAFGVFQEEISDFSRQQAFVHSYYLDYDDAVERLMRAGLSSELGKLKPLSTGASDFTLPGSLNQMVISATGGENLGGNVSGTLNPSYEAQPTYKARVDRPVVPFHEMWIWDTEAADWRTFHMTGPDVILTDSKDYIATIKKMGGPRADKYDSETNLFLKHDHPFTAITPYKQYDYFWGMCHLDTLIKLQDWSNERLSQIAEILEKQADPAKNFSGFMGMDDDRAEAWGGPGTYVFDQMPNAKAELIAPQMPEDLFREFDEIGGLFMQQSGFTEIMSGRGEKNVRGAGHARELKTTGSGRVRKVAGGLERPLVRIADIGLKLKARNDDEHLEVEIEGKKESFVIAQVLGQSKFTVRVAGHSHSPLFTAESQDLALLLIKFGAIDQEWLIRLTRPPQQASLLHALKQKQKERAKALAAQQAQGIQPAPPRSHKKQAA